MRDPAPGGPPPKPPKLRHVVRCAVCGRTLVCSPGELFDFMNKEWPECCGATMLRYVEPPGDDAR